MAQTSSFFKSIAGDKKYSADNFAEYFRSFLTSGIFNGGTNLEVTESTPNAMTVDVAIGTAWIQGYYYKNTAIVPLAISAADATNPRIDRIILRLNADDAVRSIVLAILAGTPAASPTAPALQTNYTGTGIYEISLAQVLVAANETEITNTEITDERLNGAVCGLVNSLIQVDTASFQAAWDLWFDAIQLLMPNDAELVSNDDAGYTQIAGATQQLLNDDIDAVLDTTITNMAAIIVVVEAVTITFASGWTDDTGVSGYWYYDISNANIKANSVVDVNIYLASLEDAADFKSVTESSAGSVRIYSDSQPTADIDCDLKIITQVGDL
jgi:hypothetical protein